MNKNDIKISVDMLNTRRDKLTKQVAMINDAIKTLQTICENEGGHDDEETGHDSHHTQYTCTICGRVKII